MQYNCFYHNCIVEFFSEKEICSKYVKYIENKSTSQREYNCNSFYRRKFSGARTNCHPIPCCVSEEIASRVGYHASRWERRREVLLLQYKNMPFLLYCFFYVSPHTTRSQNSDVTSPDTQ